MSDSGSGVGTPIQAPVGAGTYPSLLPPGELPNCAISLARYAYLIGYDEAAFFGVVYNGQELTDCSKLWTEVERLTLARALAEAQEMIENVTHFPLCKKWFDEKQSFVNRRGVVMTKWCHVIEMGERVVEEINAGAAVAYVTEPATIGPIATTVTDPVQVKVYLPGTEREVTPSKVTIVGGQLTIEIPRARLVTMAQPDNTVTWFGFEFTDMLNFTTTVDVRRVYTDGTTTATLWDRQRQCGVKDTEACARIEHAEVGVLNVTPIVRDNPPCCGGQRYGIQIFYAAGLETLDTMLEMAVLRLAHTLMPEDSCKQCDRIHRLWQQDSNVPPVLTRERINCPFGLSDGAWFAYQKARQARVLRMYNF